MIFDVDLEKLMKRKLLILLLFFPLLSFGNMAQTYFPGSEHSTLYGSKNCEVIKEDIFVDFTNTASSSTASYKIKYLISSDVNQNLPLIFIGIGLDGIKQITVNDLIVNSKHYNSNDSSVIRYSEHDSLSVNQDDLIYFEAKLNKGQNTIFIEYDAELDYDKEGFLENWGLKYSLYPSKFWKSFGPINLEITLDSNLEIIETNIGEPRIEGNIVKWEIKDIKVDNIELQISRKTSLFSKFLLFLHPLGISILFLILMFFVHRNLIEQKYKHNVMKYKSILLIGNLLVPILFYVVYFNSYDLIDFSLGLTRSSNHGYVFLFILTLPILMVFYGLLMRSIDRKLKRKYEIK